MLILLTIVVAIAAGVKATTRASMPGKAGTATAVAPMAVGPIAGMQAAPASADTGLIRRGMIASPLRAALGVLGDRLQRPGKERLMVNGLLRRTGDPQPTPFTLTWEFPGRLRLEQAGHGGPRVLIFDGQSLASSDGQVSPHDREAFEMLIYDSVEHFFIGQATGVGGTRFLGGRFRQDGDSASPAYDLVEVTEAVGLGGEAGEQTRTFYFNSDTQLLERVTRADFRDGAETVVETRVSDWRVVAGQQIAHRLERLENHQSTLTITFNNVAVGPRLADGLFGAAH
jgi:hypothetical protein